MKSDFLIAYDVKDEKRVGKVGRYLAKRAFRIQKSLFVLYDATYDELNEIIKGMLNICKDDEDDIRVYKIKDYGISLESAVDLENPFIV